MHYSDDQHDDDLVGPRRRGAPRPEGEEAGDDDLVGPRRGGGARSSSAAEGDEAPPRARRRSILDDDEGDAPRIAAPRLRRKGAGAENGGGGRGLSRDTLKGIFRDIPSFIKLFGRLAVDPRVSKADKAIVAAVLVYLVSPVDLIPDWVVPVVGQLEDVYLLALALSRLVNNAGVEVLMDHWEGEMSSLEAALGALDRAGSVLPAPVRAILGQRR